MPINFLKDHQLFSEIDVKVLHKYIENKSICVKTYKKGYTLHNEGEVCETLDIVETGELIAYSLAPNGSAITIFEFKRGQILGANLVFADEEIYPLNIYCKSNCKVVHINKIIVLEFLRDYTFTLAFVHSLCHNSRGLNQRMITLTKKSLRENIIDYLLQQSIIQGSKEIILPISKKQLADLLGVQRPSLFREIKKLHDDNLIDYDNRKITILY